MLNISPKLSKNSVILSLSKDQTHFQVFFRSRRREAVAEPRSYERGYD
jgi:hypothetical protein